MKLTTWRAIAPLTAITLAACGSYAPRAAVPNPDDPAHIAYLASKDYYACLEAKAGRCDAARARMIETEKDAKVADVQRVRSLHGASYQMKGM